MSGTTRMMPKTAHFNGWRDPKNIRWHLRNLSTFPSLMVPRGGPVYDLPTGTSRDIENFGYDWQGDTLTLGTAMAQDCIDGYLVVHDGKLGRVAGLSVEQVAQLLVVHLREGKAR